MFDGAGWVLDAIVVSPHGAATISRVVEFDHSIAGGATNLTSVAIPSQAMVMGIAGRVISPLAGAGLTGWRIGVGGSDNRYGSGLGLGLNSYVVGLSGSPVTYYAPTPLLLSRRGRELRLRDDPARDPSLADRAAAAGLNFSIPALVP